MEKSKSYLAASEHRDCYDRLKKSYDLDKYFFFSYDVYSLKRSRKDKDKDEDPSAGSERGLKKRKLSKDAEPTTGPKKKDSTSGSSKGTKSQLKSSGKSFQSEEPVFEVADSDMPQDQEGNLVRRADNVLYRFKEGDFLRLRINDIKDMLILVVQNLLTNLSGDDVADFPDTTRPDLRKRHSYTPYKDPQRFIYVDDFKRNRLMRSDGLYKFSDGTLTRRLSLLEDITKNIDMEYLPKRR
ncbi:hypothetical protein Tco_1141123 [Tanacetum coccineum]